ncbi:MAG: tRNA/rRNA methyltransferase (SpoU) [Bacteroidetes bacterium]|jgi:RNA methyltransferase, TrmH family|nr:tRNA/rRNA methyltransferase (SpoU) [Bacteroidota bacterium]
MLSAAQIKSIRSLAQKKERDASGLFVAEGSKCVNELLQYFDCQLLILPKEDTSHYLGRIAETVYASPKEIERASFQKTPQGVIAMFKKPDSSLPDPNKKELYLALDKVQNPGNLGTIIRLADWFGIRHIFCSLDTADAFGSKTVQATMGALGRVSIHYTDLSEFLLKIKPTIPVYGTFLGGDSIYNASLPDNAVIVMGNEGNGISNQIAECIDHRLEIPAFTNGNETSESLNVAVATAIVCSEFRRRSLVIK